MAGIRLAEDKRERFVIVDAGGAAYSIVDYRFVKMSVDDRCAYTTGLSLADNLLTYSASVVLFSQMPYRYPHTLWGALLTASHVRVSEWPS